MTMNGQPTSYYGAYLTGDMISKEVLSGAITISDFNEDRVGPNSYDVTLGKHLKVYRNTDLNLLDKKSLQTENIDVTKGYLLKAGFGYLGTTREVVGSKKYIPVLHGRSTIGRLFMMVHVTAGLGDLGFIGQWTLEIAPLAHNVWVYEGMPIAQFLFAKPIGDITKLYQGRYQGQTEVSPAKPFLRTDDLRSR